jgi:hypothetical protein
MPFRQVDKFATMGIVTTALINLTFDQSHRQVSIITLDIFKLVICSGNRGLPPPIIGATLPVIGG